MTTRAYDYIVTVANGSAFRANTIVFTSNGASVAEVLSITGNNLKVKMTDTLSEFAVGTPLVYTKSNMFAADNTRDHSANLATGVRSYSIISTRRPDSLIPILNGKVIDPSEYTQTTTAFIFNKNVVVTDNVSITSNSNTFVITKGSTFTIRQVTGNVTASSFVAANLTSYTTTANSNIVAIKGSPYTNEKNSIVQTPLVKLYNIYYPGDWYPKNANGNPSGSGQGQPWPANFPLRFAEFVGETYSDMNYSIVHDNLHYKTVTMNGSDISSSSSGAIDGTTIEISNFDGNIASLIENPYLVGYAANSTSAMINGAVVTNIDPRTVTSNLHYNLAVAQRLGTNAICSYESSMERNVAWTSLKADSRDLLGAIVEIKLTYAKFLDFWPEYSIVTGILTDVNIDVASSSPYRVGDVIVSDKPPTYSTYAVPAVSNRPKVTITNITGTTITTSYNALFNPQLGDRIYIVNNDADPLACVDYVFVINRMDEMNDFIAKFSLTNWLQYFKMKLPKRKYYNNTCPWKYKGPECKYPTNGLGTIVGSLPVISSNGMFTADNIPTAIASLDVCAKTGAACTIRNNLTNFGGFLDEKTY